MLEEAPSRSSRTYAGMSRLEGGQDPRLFTGKATPSLGVCTLQVLGVGGFRRGCQDMASQVTVPGQQGLLLSVRFLPTLDSAWLWTYTGGGQRAGDGHPSPVTKPKRHFSQQDAAQLVVAPSLSLCAPGGFRQGTCCVLPQFPHLENGESGIDLPQGGTVTRGHC